MRSARWTFGAAAVWGFVCLPPMFFLEKRIAAEQPPAITHPEFFYGFIGVALAFQFMFAIIARDPIRYRAMMIPAIVEKFGYFIAVYALLQQGRIVQPTLGFAIIDFALGMGFVMAYLQTPKA